MAKIDHFFSENIGISVLGHLVLLAAVVLLADAVFVGFNRFVAPDRIQITMIDLDNVRVSGDETVLYNTNADNNKKDDVKKPDDKKNQEQDAALKQSEEMKSTTLVPDTEKKQDKNKKSDSPAPDETVAPKTSTIVRVNRNVVSLDRTLTVSVVDALRVAMTRCWTIDTKHPGIDGIRAVAHLTMRQNGTVSDIWFESESRADTDAAFAYVLETVRSAINVCQPLRMLPIAEYDKWKKIQLTFYPTTGAVM